MADDEWKKAKEGWDADRRAAGAIPPLPQKNSNAEVPPDALSILGAAARQAYLDASKSGALDNMAHSFARAPGPGEPGYSQDVRADIANAIKQYETHRQMFRRGQTASLIHSKQN